MMNCRKLSNAFLALACAVGVITVTGCKKEISGEVFIVTNAGNSVKLGLVEIDLLSEEVTRHCVEQKLAEQESVAQQLDSQITNIKSEIDRLDKAMKGFQDQLDWSAVSQESETYPSASIEKLPAYKRYSLVYSNYQQAEFGLDTMREKLTAAQRARREFPQGDYFFSGLPSPVAHTQTDADGKFSISVPASGSFVLAAQAQRIVGNSTEHYYWLEKIPAGSHVKLTLSNNNSPPIWNLVFSK